MLALSFFPPCWPVQVNTFAATVLAAALSCHSATAGGACPHRPLLVCEKMPFSFLSDPRLSSFMAMTQG